jgi:uncharacterized membrane protein YfhO
MSRNKPLFLMVGSFLLPLVLLCLLWTSLQLAPFGDHNLLVSDLGSQYLPFLSFLKRSLQEGQPFLYSFSNEIGAPIMPMAAYYLLSPFNFLILFCTYAQLPIAILGIITLKIALTGTVMFYYFKKTYESVNWSTLLFSTAYSFCGFVTVYSQNFMWLDALLFLPLVLLGLQQLWENKKWGLYSIALFGAIVTNYYLGYMICLFAVFYSCYWLLKKQPLHAYAFSDLLKKIRLFCLTSLTTGIATSFVLLPAIEGMLQTKKTNFDPMTFQMTPLFGPSFFSQLGIGSVNYNLRLEHLPTVFTGLFVTLLCVDYFQQKGRSLREKVAAAGLLLLLFASFCFQGFNTIWHMFQLPAGFPYRNAFMFSFLLVKLAYEAYLQFQKEQKLSLLVPIFVSCLLLIGYSSLYYGPYSGLILSIHYWVLSLVMVWLFYGLLRLSTQISTQKHFKNSALCLLTVLVSVELGFNYWISLKEIPFGSQSTYEKNYQQQSDLLQQQLAENPSLYRIKQVIDSQQAGYREHNNGYNNPLLYGYAGISSYTSTLTAATQDALSQLGLYQKNDRRIAYVDRAKPINLLLNVGYEISPEQAAVHRHPIKTENGTSIVQNKEAVGMGFLVPDQLSALKLPAKQPLVLQEEILQHLVPKNEAYFKDAAVLQNVYPPTDAMQITVKTAATGDLHLFIPKLKWSKVTELKVNGQVVASPIYIETNQVFNLGYFAKDSLVTIRLTTKKTVNSADWQIKTLDQSNFDGAVNILQKQALTLKEQKNGQLKGAISVSETGPHLLYTAIPYDSNWQVTSQQNGPLPTKKVLGNFLAIQLPSGKQTLTFTYRPKIFYIGVIISITIGVGTILYQVSKKFFGSKQKPRKRKGS